MLNQRSDYLVILVGSYNRKKSLKRALDSISRGTRGSHEIIVVDGGSVDGTIEYLQSHPGITPVFQGQMLGLARSFNQVWREVESKYTCWLSDDTELVDGSLDLAVEILEKHPEIGMVGLKTRDTQRTGVQLPYTGGISHYGILNCNHGVLPTALLRAAGYFNESYHSYLVDPDLTASVLCTGKLVAMTEPIGVLHHREYINDENERVRRKREAHKGVPVYLEKFQFLDVPPPLSFQIRSLILRHLGRVLFANAPRDMVRFGLNKRDWRNIAEGRFIKLTDPWNNRRERFHLVQKIPYRLLSLNTNPLRHLVAPPPK
ncbi:MAG: hypothetical protein A2Y80_03105 [Deltaproteobacteria bacterium RBG_13_58_19]|nr:MAG: hypothetical protein A2Y80_03105 [Deltaproteobacteria bacterium RBG_13_58_19]